MCKNLYGILTQSLSVNSSGVIHLFPMTSWSGSGTARMEYPQRNQITNMSMWGKGVLTLGKKSFHLVTLEVSMKEPTEP